MKEFYIAVKTTDCEPHYFQSCSRALYYAFGCQPSSIRMEMRDDGRLTYIIEDKGWVECCRFDDVF